MVKCISLERKGGIQVMIRDYDKQLMFHYENTSGKSMTIESRGFLTRKVERIIYRYV
jgi:hypothetical protein